MHSVVPIGEFASVYEVTAEQMRAMAEQLAAPAETVGPAAV